MSPADYLSLQCIISDPIKEWPKSYRTLEETPKILSLFLQIPQMVRENPSLKEKVIQYIEWTNPSIYTGIGQKIQRVITECGLGGDVYKNIRKNMLVNAIGMNCPSFLFLKSLSEEPVILEPYRAAMMGDVEFLKNNSLEFITFYSEHQFNLLHCAALFDQSAVLEYLLDRTPHFPELKELRTMRGWTPLIFAVRNDAHRAINLLLDRGADIEAKIENNQTPLMIAAMRDHKETLELLLNRGANIEASDNVGMTALHFAAMSNVYENVELLIQRGANIEAKTVTGFTPLMMAMNQRNFEIIPLLQAALQARYPAPPPPVSTLSSTYAPAAPAAPALERPKPPPATVIFHPAPPPPAKPAAPKKRSLAPGESSRKKATPTPAPSNVARTPVIKPSSLFPASSAAANYDSETEEE